MSDRVTWVEMLDIDPARAYRMRIEEAEDRNQVSCLHGEIEKLEERVWELEEEVRGLTVAYRRCENRMLKYRRLLRRIRIKRRRGQTEA
jgi:hypothetical protein